MKLVVVFRNTYYLIVCWGYQRTIARIIDGEINSSVYFSRNISEFVPCVWHCEKFWEIVCKTVGIPECNELAL